MYKKLLVEDGMSRRDRGGGSRDNPLAGQGVRYDGLHTSSHRRCIVKNWIAVFALRIDRLTRDEATHARPFALLARTFRNRPPVTLGHDQPRKRYSWPLMTRWPWKS
jgi:hypothetical protein